MHFVFASPRCVCSRDAHQADSGVQGRLQGKKQEEFLFWDFFFPDFLVFFLLFKFRWPIRWSEINPNQRARPECRGDRAGDIYLMYSSSEVQDVSSSVLSSKSGRLPQSNTFTPGGKETKKGGKKEIFLDCDLILKLHKCLFWEKIIPAKVRKSRSWWTNLFSIFLQSDLGRVFVYLYIFSAQFRG